MKEEILKRLDILAAKFSTTADHLWGVLIKQARVEAISDALLLCAVLVGVWYTIKWGRWIVTKCEDEIVWIPFGLVSIVLIVIGIVCLTSIPTELLNPEYFALKRVLEAAGR